MTAPVAPKPIQMRAKQQPRVAPPPLPATPMPLSQLEKPAEPLGIPQFELAPISTVPLPELHTLSSGIAGVPAVRLAARREPPPVAFPLQDLLRQQLASAQSLRSAFVIREILGPPLGLQT
jgi:hypothetical protein